MLIKSNGTAYFDEPSAHSDIDDKGLPIKGERPSIEVPCYIEVGNENRSGRGEDGKFPRVSFTLYIDYGSVGEDFHPTKVRVEHERKGDMGTFSIQRTEFYDFTRTIQIWV